MTKTDVLNRVTLKSTKNEVKQVAKVIDLNSPANPRLTYALYNANRAASKIDGCKVFNDWHKQGLTTGECNTLIAEYNKVTGYVYTPKVKPAKVAKEGVKTPKGLSTSKGAKSAKEGGKIEVPENKHNPIHNSNLTASMRAQIDAIKEMRKEGLLTVAELTEALRAIQA